MARGSALFQIGEAHFLMTFFLAALNLRQSSVFTGFAASSFFGAAAAKVDRFGLYPDVSVQRLLRHVR